MNQRRPRRKSGAGPLPDQGLPPEANPQLQAALLEIVDRQLAQGDPPEAAATLERLVGMGYTREGARQLIAQAVLREIFSVMSSGQPYDSARYLAALARLPTLPEPGA